MLVRALGVCVALLLPFQAAAADYMVRPGDTLGMIAHRYGVAISTLARVNHVQNVNLLQVGRVLFIPSRNRTFFYHVHWGDTLLGIASRYGLSLAAIRSLNPSLGAYLLAGQWLRLCGPCGGGGSTAPSRGAPGVGAASTFYIVRAGDTLGSIAGRYGVSTSALLAANRIPNPNVIVLGSRLVIPRAAAPVTAAHDPWHARSLIAWYGRLYGLDPALPLAVGWQESGFNQNMVSATGAIGVMQVEPYTGQHIGMLLGRSFNLYLLDDNIHAGVFWLARLVAYYGGDQRLAVAAYYEGTRAIARYGLYRDTIQYVNNVMALEASFGG